ncbi:hypothetical protein STEG23_005561 [Scotinomys teguina]
MFCGFPVTSTSCLHGGLASSLPAALPWTPPLPFLVPPSEPSPNHPSLVLYLPPHVLWLPGNFYILSSWRSGVFSSCCLALDSSSSFPCPAFRAIAKSDSSGSANVYLWDFASAPISFWMKFYGFIGDDSARTRVSQNTLHAGQIFV